MFVNSSCKVLLISSLFIGFSSFAQNSAKSESGPNFKTVQNWFNLDPTDDKINGISTEKAYELVKDKKSTPIVVAIIDSGIEIDHEDLKGKIWTNEKEIPNNGLDDDKNGYIDDINGWDFLGNANGNDLTYETLEITREYKKYLHLIEPIDALNATAEQKVILERYKMLKAKYDEKVEDIDKKGGRFFLQLYDNYNNAKTELKTAFKVDEITDDILNKISSTSEEKLQKAKKVFQLLEQVGLKEEDLQEGYDYFNALINYGLNEDYNGRSEIIKDNLLELNEKGYGNNEVEGPNAFHGTHVAGIIAANRKNEIGMKGVADNVKIMTLRAVPDGDERDKDVANAIKYAANNGARVINMSFGKAISPEKSAVDEAVKYAENKGVLIVHAAGNDNLDLDIESNFPNKIYNDNTRCNNWIEVGAMSWEAKQDMVASFSNYGKKSVDVFAPGKDLYSLGINGKYREMSGTSMAAPVVSGMAAMIWSYFPNLSAVQVKSLIIESCSNLGNNEVIVPGKNTVTQFKNLSVTGGEVNLFKAIKLAQNISN